MHTKGDGFGVRDGRTSIDHQLDQHTRSSGRTLAQSRSAQCSREACVAVDCEVTLSVLSAWTRASNGRALRALQPQLAELCALVQTIPMHAARSCGAQMCAAVSVSRRSAWRCMAPHRAAWPRMAVWHCMVLHGPAQNGAAWPHLALRGPAWPV
eukprot:353449-Chlamydomonas_euryale.AAC.8